MKLEPKVETCFDCNHSFLAPELVRVTDWVEVSRTEDRVKAFESAGGSTRLGPRGLSLKSRGRRSVTYVPGVVTSHAFERYLCTECVEKREKKLRDEEARDKSERQRALFWRLTKYAAVTTVLIALARSCASLLAGPEAVIEQLQPSPMEPASAAEISSPYEPRGKDEKGSPQVPARTWATGAGDELKGLY